MWIKDFSEDEFSIYIESDNIYIKNGNLEFSLRERIFNRIQIGGEQKYGFGLLELKGFIKSDQNKLQEFSGEWFEDGNEVKLKLDSNDSIWAHLLHTNGFNIKGNIEPLVGREWDADKGAGRRLTSYGLFWIPGSILNENNTFKINEFGLWEALP